MITKKELTEWLDTLSDDADIWINDGGLILESDDGIYLEVGGEA